MKIELKKIPEDLNWIDVLILKALQEDLPLSISKLYEKGFINHQHRLTLRGNEILNNVHIENNDKKTINENKTNKDFDFEKFIDNYRLKFKGKKLGVMGDKNALREKMIRFLNIYHYYSCDHILNAIQLYINSCAKDNYLYLTQAHYTVYKKTSKEEVSILAAFCEELEEGETVRPVDEFDNDNTEML